MKRRFIAILCVLALTFGLCGGISAVADSSITLTAVNDSLLPLSSSTMPVQKNGDWYVPYTTFANGSTTRSALGLIAAYNSSQQIILVYDTNGRSLNFQIAAGFVTDENGTYYSQPAYIINNTVYLPVKTVCNKFELSYSYISSTYNYLRIISSARISDSLFASAAKELAGKMINTYKKNQSSASSSTPPATSSKPSTAVPVTPPNSSSSTVETPELEEKNPSSLTLLICGYPGYAASSMVDTLNKHNLHGNFFVDGSAILTEDRIIRKILAGGHSVGIDIPSSALTDKDTLTAYLAQANEDLFLVSGSTTRLCHVDGGSSGRLTKDMLSALSDCGYRLWDDTGSAVGSSSDALAQSALAIIHKSENRCILNLGMTRTVSAAMPELASDITTNSIHTMALSEYDTPVNDYNYTE